MQIALVKPYEDESIQDVHIVEHPTKQGDTEYRVDWDECLEATKKENPEEWQVGEVIEKMEEKGWRFLLCEHVSVVTY